MEFLPRNSGNHENHYSRKAGIMAIIQTSIYSAALNRRVHLCAIVPVDRYMLALHKSYTKNQSGPPPAAPVRG